MADPENEEQIFDPSMKKKKKKKKTAFDLDSALAGGSQTTEEAAATADDTQNTDAALNMEDVKQALPAEKEKDAGDVELDLEDEFSLTKKKKSKKKIKINDTAQILGADETTSSVTKVAEGEYALTDEDYTYEQLLNRVFTIMREKNPDMQSGGKRRYVSKPPLLARVGTKKTAFTNFGDICKQMKRQPKHLLQFLLAELGTSGNVDANDSLILKGRYQQKHIETVLRRYIKEYVTCHTCTSPDTILEREIRLFFLTCQNCGSRSSVASIKSGFQAVTGKRAAMRAKTA